MAEFGDQRLKMFLEVAESGSFTAASKRFGVSQPAVSQNISALEDQLGIRLFDRQRGNVVLTDRGRVFARYAEKILYWYDSAELMFGEEARRSSNTSAKLAADNFCASIILPGAVAVIHASWPAARFDIVPAGTPGADATVEIVPATAGDGILTSMDSVIFCRNNDPIAGISSLEWLPQKERFAVWKDCLPSLPADIKSRITAVSDSTELIRGLVAASSDMLGIAPLPGAIGFQPLPILLPGLSFGIRYSPAPLFAGRAISSLIARTIKDSFSK